MSLTDDDKQWLEERFAKLAKLATMEALREVEKKLATMEALREVETKLAKFATMEALRDVETKLLTEFHKWSSPVEMRQRTHSAALRAVDLELEALADRVTKLEPPH